MYVPKHAHFLFPVGAVLTTFSINQWVLGGGFHWDFALLVQVPVAAIAYHWGHFIDQAGIIWQKYEAGEPAEPPKPATIPLNHERGQTMLQFTQVTEAPRLNNERKFAKTLIAMRNGNLKVDMTEAYWIEDGNGNRYGEEREKFAEMKKRWARNGVIVKKGTGYQVIDWRQVRLVADGIPLPHQ